MEKAAQAVLVPYYSTSTGMPHHVMYVVVSLGKRELAADTDVRMDTARGWLVSEMQFFSVLCRHSSVQMNYFSCVWTLTTTDD